MLERRNGTVLPWAALTWGHSVCSWCACMTSVGAITTSYAKGEINALNTLFTGDFPSCDDVLWKVGATQVDLMETVNTFFIALYGQPPGTPMESERHTLFTN